jgi:hypothetical protein
LYNLPLSDRLREVIEVHDGHLTEEGERGDVVLELGLGDASTVRQLATDALRVIGRSRERDYKDPNFSWICRRTSESLKRLATTLVAYRRERARSVRQR